MNQSLTTISVLVVLFLIGMSGLTLAIQDRRPVDPPTPTPQEQACPTAFMDMRCLAEGESTDAVYAWALSQAGFMCDGQMQRCYVEQATELSKNKLRCEVIPGCTLKYIVTTDDCEMGNYLNCDPLPGTVIEDKNTTYTCTISGEYDIEGYRCDRGPANEGEQTA